jgi:hypothetical protein
MCLQAQVEHDTPQVSILVTQLPKFAQLGHFQLALLLFSHAEARFARAQLPAVLRDRRGGLGLAQRLDDLFPGRS